MTFSLILEKSSFISTMNSIPGKRGRDILRSTLIYISLSLFSIMGFYIFFICFFGSQAGLSGPSHPLGYLGSFQDFPAVVVSLLV